MEESAKTFNNILKLTSSFKKIELISRTMWILRKNTDDLMWFVVALRRLAVHNSDSTSTEQ